MERMATRAPFSTPSGMVLMMRPLPMGSTSPFSGTSSRSGRRRGARRCGGGVVAGGVVARLARLR
eukprot:scaffold113840_cov15-Phaeocystis_antarctica.AAC.1